MDVARHLGYEVRGLAAYSNKHLLLSQAAQWPGAKTALISESGLLPLIDMVEDPEIDIVVVSLASAQAILPTYRAALAGKRIALATKEVLVAAGTPIMAAVNEGGGELIPVDSEHCALYQCLQGDSAASRLILTASGGPFRNHTKEQLKKVTLNEALKHPNWSMGAKITVDSSTLMNKGLEVIEAHHLFGFEADQIDVVIHPESLIHSMVEYPDGSVIAQVALPDMKLPIQYALTAPARCGSLVAPIDWKKAQSMTFHPPDIEKFPCLGLAFEALRQKGSAPCFLNSANEALVTKFRQGKISWSAISSTLESLFSRHTVHPSPDLETLVAIDRETRESIERSL